MSCIADRMTNIFYFHKIQAQYEDQSDIITAGTFVFQRNFS